MAASRPSGRRFTRALLLLLPALGLAGFIGCEDAYNVEMKYPLRKDWIVNAESLEGTPPKLEPPGYYPLQLLDGRTQIKYLGYDLMKAKEQGKILDPRSVFTDSSSPPSQELMLALREIAGRPRNPKIDVKDDALNDRLVKELKLDRKTLTAGSLLYRRNCLHCHGLNGDGKGPTGPWLHPHPRDFRQGAFKFTSSGQIEGERKPRQADLLRILDNGIDGTAMPSFTLLKAEEKEAIINYVIHLSIRGEVEIETMKAMILDKDQKPEEGTQPTPIYVRAYSFAKVIGQRWVDAQAAEIKPTPAKVPDYKTELQRLEAAARGYKFFTRPDQCVKCHTNFGRDSDYRFDQWGTIVLPRDFSKNVFRGGRRPIDLYWRIHSGIKGAGMPALIAKPEDLAEKESTIWDLVAFLQVLPYPEERAKLRPAPFNVNLD